MAQFMLFVRNEDLDWKNYSPEDYQKTLMKFSAWYKQIQEKGKFVGSGKLKDNDGVTLRFRGNENIVDGPYCETKEAIGGVFVIEVNNYDEAKELASDCPMLQLGGSVEIREMEIDFHTA